MLNYIRAEIYKVLHRKYIYIVLAVMLFLETLPVAGFAFHNAHSFPTPFGGAVILIVELGQLGFCFVLLTGDMVFAGQYKNSTLKNEVSFGLSRTRIYLGKLIVQTLLSIVYLVVIIGYFLGVCAVILPLEAEAAAFYSVPEALAIVGWFLGVAFPLWVGAQGVVCACLFLIPNDIGASMAALGITMVLSVFVQLTGLLVQGETGELLLKIYEYMPQPILGAAKSAVGDWSFMGKVWIVGVFWLVVCTAIGLYGFKRKEIK